MVIYLDYNATTPYDEKVKATILSSITNSWANPSSTHTLGQVSKRVVDDSRVLIAQMLSGSADDIVFTSGGTESNHMAIGAAIEYFKCNYKKLRNGEEPPKPHIISSNIEHDSITVYLNNLVKKEIIDVTFVPVFLETAQIRLRDIKEEIRDETCLVTVMMANNETGIIQPVEEIAAYISDCRSCPKPPVSLLFHVDAAQAIGKVDVNVAELLCDFLTIAGHKFYGPRIGALYIRDRSKKQIEPMFYGGGQEMGLRSGTENVAMIAGLGQAAHLVWLNLLNYQENMIGIRDYLEKQLVHKFEERITFNNHRIIDLTEENLLIADNMAEVARLPNTVSVSFKDFNITGAEILSKAQQLCASTGAACHHKEQISSVLLNCGVERDAARSTLRLSVGRETTKREIDEALNLIESALKN